MASRAALPLAARPPVNAIPKPILMGSAASAERGETPEVSSAPIRRLTMAQARTRPLFRLIRISSPGVAGEPSVSQLRKNAKRLRPVGAVSTMARDGREHALEEATMETVEVGMDEMLRRVARFKDLRPSPRAFVDSLIAGHEREIFNVIGRGVTEDTTLSPAITDARDFNLTLVRDRKS